MLGGGHQCVVAAAALGRVRALGQRCLVWSVRRVAAHIHTAVWRVLWVEQLRGLPSHARGRMRVMVWVDVFARARAGPWPCAACVVCV